MTPARAPACRDGGPGGGPTGSLINMASGPPLLHNRQKGWQLLASRTNPGLAAADATAADDKIELGEWTRLV